MAGQLRTLMLTDSKESSPVIFEEVSNALPELLSSESYSSIGVLVDENTERHCFPGISDHIPAHELIRISSGESNKTLDGCRSIWDQLTALNFDRRSLMINLGGGVIGDMGGFCAATFKRGIDFVNIPTTLLAQVDASVGGKLGIDFQDYKNHIGVFQSPRSVIINTKFLGTLDERQLRSGFAEVIKHSLIADASSWAELSSTVWSNLDWSNVVPKSVEIKRKIVDQDPKEKGLRKILNFGHTIGHAIETYYLSQPQNILHGEAIAAGMIAEAFLSTQKTGLSSKELDEICRFLISIYGKISVEPDQFDHIVGLTVQDKKNVGSELRLALLQGIGQAKHDVPTQANEIRSALEFYLNI